MSIFTDAKADIESVWAKIEGVFDADVAPYLKQFLEQFASQDGKLILTAGIEAAGQLATGTPFGAVATALVTSLLSQSETIAKADASTTLAQIQSAIQIGKVVNAVQSPSDVTAVAAITAAQSSATTATGADTGQAAAPGASSAASS